MTRDVNAEGLGDRRGFAIERVHVQQYEPGSNRPAGMRLMWRVYEDGVTRATVPSRKMADAVVDWLGRVPGLESNKERDRG